MKFYSNKILKRVLVSGEGRRMGGVGGPPADEDGKGMVARGRRGLI